MTEGQAGRSIIHSGRIRFNVIKNSNTNFRVEGEDQGFRLHIGDKSGNTSDSMSGHDSLMFSTYDRDNDKGDTHCAEYYKGAWWFKSSG